MNLKLSFCVNKLPLCFASFKGGAQSLVIQAADGILTVLVLYDFHSTPLKLFGEIAENDLVDVILLEHRIELYVNGELKDEEWPAGNRYFEYGDGIDCDIDVAVTEYSEPVTELPDIISTFENAEGWRPGNDVFVGDCMPYRKNDEYHVLYLKDRHHHGSKWSLGAHQWGHISTKDFKTWYVHPMAVPITESWEGSICTGSWIEHEGREYLYYTVRRDRVKPAPICRSVSSDGYHFTKDKNFGFTLDGKYNKACARDPKVVKGDDGLFHMFLTTKLVKEDRGCLAHYVSKDLEKWEECDTPIYISPDSNQPECPDYYKYNGKYYLVFSIQGKAHYMISDKPFSDFKMPENPIIPCARVPKCAEWQGRLVFAGFDMIGGYAGTMTFKAARAAENGELIFEEL